MTPTTQPAEHTKEPWLTGEPEVGFTHDIDNHVYPGLPEQDLALLPLNDYRRAIACVNACAGIPDPESAIEQARALIESMPMHDLPHTPECLRAGLRCICWHAKYWTLRSNLTPATDKQG